MIRPLAISLLASAALGAIHAAESPAETAAALIAENQDALVDVHAVLKIETEVTGLPAGAAAEVPEQEQSIDAKGVVIHSSGLVAVPLVMLDPMALLGEEGMSLDTPAGPLTIKMRNRISTIKIITADGREHSGEVVLREPAAGLALVKLTSPPEGALKAITLAPDLPAVPPFSQCYDIIRLGADFNRAPAVRLIRIVRETPAPFPLYELTGPLQSPGSATFDETGRFLGMTMVPIRGQGLTDTRPYLVPAAEIQRLGAKLMP